MVLLNGKKRLGKGKLPSITPTDMPLYILYVKKDSKDFIYFYNGKRLVSSEKKI